MKSHTEYFTFNTKKKRELVHLTPQLEQVLERAGVDEGFMLVSAMHITAGVFVNDNESGLHEDIWKWLEGIAPFRADYAHHRTGEDNGDAHLKSLLIHHEVIVPITKGRLDLGTWQQVFYAEFDGQRAKRLIVKVLGE
jgi:secondary thiamine-phosphate synthase enzyme